MTRREHKNGSAEVYALTRFKVAGIVYHYAPQSLEGSLMWPTDVRTVEFVQVATPSHGRFC